MIDVKNTPYITHLLDIQSIDKETIHFILDRADYYLKEVFTQQQTLDTLKGKVIVNLFFEPSTRTQHSFEIAGKMLGAIVINPMISNLSTIKGESFIDTIKTFEAMGTNLFIIRHIDNNTPEFIASELKTKTSLINAGDGNHSHPTQCLTDLLTIRQHKPNFADLKVVIVGDITHSRVASSFIAGLNQMGTTDIHLVGPEPFIPPEYRSSSYTIAHSIKEAVTHADVIMCLRIQKERMEKTQHPNSEKFYNQFAVTQETIFEAKKDVLIMHPGPINRGIEIESSVADGKNSTILQQVRNGVAVRMAIMDIVLNKA